jgi:hypothetical protein
MHILAGRHEAARKRRPNAAGPSKYQNRWLHTDTYDIDGKIDLSR